MKAVVTHGFLESIPKKIRTKFRLRAGMVLDFDENAGYLKAMPPVASAEPADGFESWLTLSIGLAKDRLTTDGLLLETRQRLSCCLGASQIHQATTSAAARGR